MNNEELKAKIVLSSIPLTRLEKNNLPSGAGSGCLVRYSGKLLVLTVEHVTGDFGNWAIEVEWTPSLGRMSLYQIGGMNFLKRSILNADGTGELDFSKAEKIDFSYAILKAAVTPLYQELEANGTIKNSVETITLTTNFQCVPSTSLKYGFYGRANGKLGKPTLESVKKSLKAEARLEMGMTLIDQDKDFFLFQMQETESRLEYEGCSGAPILDSNGELVSLVAKVWPKGRQVLGVKLSNYKAVIDIACGNFAQ